MIIQRPRATVDVRPWGTTKMFRERATFERELSWYQRLPWAHPELTGVDYERLTITMRTFPLAYGAEFDRLEMAKKLYALILQLWGRGIHHRDVHPRNIVLRDDGPLLIDWECAIEVDGQASYDLHGPRTSMIAPPEIHRAIRSKVSPNGYEMYWGADHPMSIKNQWGVDVDELSSGVEGRPRSGTR